MIRLTMNGTRTLLVLSLALFLAGTLPALAQGPVRADLPGADSSELSGWLPVRLVCQDCTEDLLMSVVTPRPGPAVPRPRSHRVRSTVRRLNA